jgi:Flp pilus assembly protein TadD
LRQALAASPDAGPVHHALGLSLSRQKRTAEAMTSLAKAVELSPEEARFGYVLAVALHDTGKRAEAIGTLKRALVRTHDQDVLLALAHYVAEARDFASAVERALLLSRLEPDRRDIAQLLASLKQRAR